MDIVKTISNKIANQFPDVYRETGEDLVLFLEAYYEFLESTPEYSEYLNRTIFDANDIDKTLDDFIVHFKYKYLSQFPYDTFVDKRFMIKHIKDFYRSKGSKKSVELLMKILFGEEVEVYYPARDILKPSESKWIIPNYIELESSERAASFVGKKIIGSSSKATAFADGVVRKRSNGKLVDVLFISNLSKEFVDGDYITDDGVLTGAPRVSGSLSTVNIVQGGVNYNLGDEVNLQGQFNGTEAKGVVEETINPSDKVTLNLLDGGYGYSLNSSFTSILISQDKISTNQLIDDIQVYDIVKQYAFTTTHASSIPETIVGDIVDIKDAGVSQGQGVVLSADASNIRVQFNGTISDGVNENLGFLETAGTWTLQHSSEGSFTISTPVDDTVEAYYLGSKGFGFGVYYSDPLPATLFEIPTDSELAEMRLSTDTTIRYNLLGKSTGSGFDFDIETLKNTRDMTFNTDLISPYLSTSLNSSNYGFPAGGSETLSTVLDTAFSTVTETVGEIDTLTNFNPGAGYDSDPIVAIVNPYLFPSNILNISATIQIENIFGISKGDFVAHVDNATQETSLGIVYDFSYPQTGIASVEIRLHDNVNTVETANTLYFYSSTMDLKGEGLVTAQYRVGTSSPMGLNARVDASIADTTGTINKIRVLDSGFGYITDEDIVISAVNNESSTLALGTAVADKGGVAEGYWETTTSHLNSSNFIRDNYYYQEYSYEIQSGLALDKYKDIIKNTVHIAGTELFGKVINKSTGSLDINVAQSELEII